jgi:hypothetical protein
MIKALKKSDNITKGRGVRKAIEENATTPNKDYEITKEGNTKVEHMNTAKTQDSRNS